MDVLGALAPPIVVAALFYLIMRTIIRADRRERAIKEKLREDILARRKSPSSETGDGADL